MTLTRTRIALGCAAMMLLSACGTDTEIIDSNPRSVTIVYDGSQDKLQKAFIKARKQCQMYGPDFVAVLHHQEKVEDGNAARFDCVPSGDARRYDDDSDYRGRDNDRDHRRYRD